MMYSIFRYLATVALTSIILFIFINTIAWLMLKPDGTDIRWRDGFQIAPQSKKGVMLRKRILGIENEPLLEELRNSPGLRPHTVLSFTTRTSKPGYTTGILGMRYESSWTDKEARDLLNDSVWIFGGSTVYGQGVDDDSTLAAFLNRMSPNTNFINFGTNAYDSQREGDKLLYLLRLGHRPKSVVFIDGLNDASTFASSPYEGQNKPRPEGYLLERSNLSLVYGFPDLPNMARAFTYSLPITHFFIREKNINKTIKYGDIDPNQDAVNMREVAWYAENYLKFSEQNTNAILEEWPKYYARHINFIENLGRAFDFETLFVLQPIGHMDRKNPFVLDQWFESHASKYFSFFLDMAKKNIKEGNLKMLSCTDTFDAIDRSMAYIDSTHYSPQGNEQLAKCLLAGLKKH